jgi:hypothetical protein
MAPTPNAVSPLPCEWTWVGDRWVLTKDECEELDAECDGPPTEAGRFVGDVRYMGCELDD